MMFTNEVVQAVWEKAVVVEGYDSSVIRKDACGAWILRGQYGMRDAEYGWEIDHVFPESMGGGDDLINLRAMHWENNVSKGDDFPSYKSVLKADGNKNVRIEGQFKVNKQLLEQLRKLYC